MNKKIYAVGISAHNPKKRTFAVSGRAVRAISEAEAVGLGILLAKDAWPQEEGWIDYQASPNEVPREWIEEVTSLFPTFK